MLILKKDDYKERDHCLLIRVGLAPKDCITRSDRFMVA
jgi:hypothetical protein